MAAAVTADPWPALADPTRRAVLRLVVDGPRSVAAIAEHLPVSRPAVSQHLRVLLDAGLVDVERQGRRHLYAVRHEGLEVVRRDLEAFWGTTLTNLRRVAEQAHHQEPS